MTKRRNADALFCSEIQLMVLRDIATCSRWNGVYGISKRTGIADSPIYHALRTMEERGDLAAIIIDLKVAYVLTPAGKFLLESSPRLEALRRDALAARQAPKKSA